MTEAEINQDAPQEESLVKKVNDAEKIYRTYKFQLALEKSILALEVDWNKVNQNRINQGLPKITNQEQRNHYFKVHFAEEDEELLKLELAYRSLEREFERELRE